MKDNLVLFDVDGTLTEARKPIGKEMLKALRVLSRYCELGFVTGSGLEYLKEQMWPAFNDPQIRATCHLLPCNGTEYLITSDVGDVIFNSISKEVMSKKIGVPHFNHLLKKLCHMQSEMLYDLKSQIPLSGHFIQNRQSMINWCPIGRNATPEQRVQFKAIDKLTSVRNKYVEKLQNYISIYNTEITVKLGGNTSFDIFPIGWAKIYALTHFDASKWNFWFVGDKCSPLGNDLQILDLLKDNGTAFETGSILETLDIIYYYILPEIGDI